MQKTLKYNLDESYAQGYNDAREEIAKKIEAQIKDNEWAGAYIIAAAIARGNN